MSHDVNILLTMDIEPLSIETMWKGPPSVEASERSIRAFSKIVQDAGFPVSLFVHPEMAQLQRRLLRELERDGACMGLHIHATKFQHPLWDYEFGAYSADDQRAMLEDGKEQWAMALDHAPLTFRPGAYSANDMTFPTLVAAGFRGGGVSLPGRVWRARYCCWHGAEFDPHRAHEAFRLVRGAMPFANLPVSVDLTTSVILHGVPSLQRLHPKSELPVDTLLRNILAGIRSREPNVPTLHLTANNGEPYEDEDDIWAPWLRATLEALRPVCAEFDYRPAPATVESVTEQVLGTDRWRAPQWTGDHDLEGGGQRPLGGRSV
jgi:hypothetical protein